MRLAKGRVGGVGQAAWVGPGPVTYFARLSEKSKIRACSKMVKSLKV